jgi:fluoride exporter
VKYLLVVAGGGAGSLLRFLAGTAIMVRFGRSFPLGTLVINVTGSFLIGLFMSLFTERYPGQDNLRFLLVVGFLGGYTTFSSFEWETYSLIRPGGFWLGLANVAGSVVFGYLAVWAGALLARR